MACLISSKYLTQKHERNEFVFDVFRLLAIAILVIRQDKSPEHYLGCVYVFRSFTGTKCVTVSAFLLGIWGFVLERQT